MATFPDWEADQATTEISDLVNFAVLLRSLIVDEGFTELTFRNPRTSQERMLLVNVISLEPRA
jgi:hypothetical protein